MYNKLFKKKSETELVDVFSPLSGKVVALEDVPDPVFSQKMMGEGIAIVPDKGELVSPIDAEVVQVFHTKHAIGLRTMPGLELLIHIGLETVELEGEGFEVLVDVGKKVKCGDPLVNFNIELIKSRGKEIITPIIITNSSDIVTDLELCTRQYVMTNNKLMSCSLR